MVSTMTFARTICHSPVAQRSIHKSDMENLILFCGNNAQGDERIMNVLEIVVLMLREQVR